MRDFREEVYPPLLCARLEVDGNVGARSGKRGDADVLGGFPIGAAIVGYSIYGHVGDGGGTARERAVDVGSLVPGDGHDANRLSGRRVHWEIVELGNLGRGKRRGIRRIGEIAFGDVPIIQAEDTDDDVRKRRRNVNKPVAPSIVLGLRISTPAVNRVLLITSQRDRKSLAHFGHRPGDNDRTPRCIGLDNGKPLRSGKLGDAGHVLRRGAVPGRKLVRRQRLMLSDRSGRKISQIGHRRPVRATAQNDGDCKRLIRIGFAKQRSLRGSASFASFKSLIICRNVACFASEFHLASPCISTAH